MLNLQGEFVSGERRGRWLAMRYGSGGIVEARNRAVARFLEGDDEWLLWIDTDMGFEAADVKLLLDTADKDDRPVVGGLCFANHEVRPDGFGGFATFPIPTVYRWARQPDGSTGFVSWHEYPRDEVYRCEGTGSAFILIHRSVFERMENHRGNWYGLVAGQDGAAISEDLSFCLRCAEHDIPIHVHTGVKTTHLKPVWLSETHFDLHVGATERG